MGPWLVAAAHISAVCSALRFLYVGVRALVEQQLRGGNVGRRAPPASAASGRPAPAAFGSAPASSSALIISVLALKAASASGVDPSWFRTFGFAPAFSRRSTRSASFMFAAHSSAVDAIGFRRIHIGRFLRNHLDRSRALTGLDGAASGAAAASVGRQHGIAASVSRKRNPHGPRPPRASRCCRPACPA